MRPNIKKTFIIHPFLFALFPVLFLFYHNLKELSFPEIVPSSIFVLSFSFLLFLLLRFIIKDNKKAGIIVSVFLLTFFSYGHIFGVTQHWRIGNFGFGSIMRRYILYLFLIFGSGIFFAWVTYFIIRTRGNLRDFTNILNIVAIFLVIIPLINIGIYKRKTMLISQKMESRENIEINTLASAKKIVLRDIYYIILDRYGSQIAYKEIFDFDNSEFMRYLSNKGFYVAPNSRCNYAATFLSLASSLNMEYLNYLSSMVGKDSDDQTIAYKMLQDCKVWRFLKTRGYKFIHFGSSWGPTSKNKYADENFNYYLLPEFSMLLYKTTILCPILGAFNFGLRKEEWKRVLYQFDKLAQIPNIKEPTFTFVHIIAPHYPYVFNQDGSFVTRFQEERRSLKENFVNQTIFLNKKLKILIEKLLSNSETPPIIILQSDEGPKDEFPGKVVDKLSKKEIIQQTGILNAYYLPNIDKNILYSFITPVNSFRLIFNLYFNTSLELLADETYLPGEEHPYNFLHVD